MKIKILIITYALFIAFLISASSFRIAKFSHENLPRLVEQGAYLQYPNILHLRNIKLNGTIPTSLNLITGGERTILQPLLTGILAPQLSGWPYLHIIYLFFPLALFLIFFGLLVYELTKSKSCSLLAITFYLSHQMIFDPDWSLGFGFSDYQATFYLGAAILLLEFYFMNGSKKILKFVGFLAFMAFLVRTTAFFYIIFLFVPILLFYFLSIIKTPVKLFAEFKLLFIKFIPWFLAIFIVLFFQLKNLFWYYTSGNVSTVGNNFFDSVKILSTHGLYILGYPVIFLLIIILLYNLKIFLIQKKFRILIELFKNLSKPVYFANLWWFFGFLGLLLFMRYTSDSPKEVYYFIPPLILLCLLPLCVDKDTGKTRLPKIISIPAFLLLYFVFYRGFTGYNPEKYLGPKNVVLNNYQKNIAHALSTLPDNTSWSSFTTPDLGIPISLLTYYTYGKTVTANNDFFHNRKNYWIARYGDISEENISEKVLQKAGRCINAVIVLINPQIKPPGMEQFSYNIARLLSSKVKQSKNWSFYKSIPGNPYWPGLSVYLNNNLKYNEFCR